MLLVVIVVVGGILVWSRYSASQAKAISITDDYSLETTTGTVCISGAVANPGLYPLKADDSLGSLLKSAGTTTSTPAVIKLHIGEMEDAAPQKINLNRAELWLLKALPGIGEELAQAIIDYRLEHGPLASTSEITRVPGIGIKTFEQIKNLITVTD
jgi:competence protein ComEA